jgi:hypothetical protein
LELERIKRQQRVSSFPSRRPPADDSLGLRPERLVHLAAAKAVLGHTDTKITEIYAERDIKLATRVMREID